MTGTKTFLIRSVPYCRFDPRIRNEHSERAQIALVRHIIKRAPIHGGRSESCDPVRRQRHAPATVHHHTAETAHAGWIQACLGTPAQMATQKRNTRCLHHHWVSWPPDSQLLWRRTSMEPSHQLHR